MGLETPITFPFKNYKRQQGGGHRELNCVEIQERKL